MLITRICVAQNSFPVSRSGNIHVHVDGFQLLLALIVRSRPFQVEREEGCGDTAIPNVCLALRSVRANQIARATCYFLSHVIVIWLLSQWQREDNQIHSQSKNISELKATLAAHSWTRLQHHHSQQSSYLYECLNYSTFVLMIALTILEEQR